MPIIVLEGVDNTGKSTVIKQLTDNYPHLKSFAFPSKAYREFLSQYDAELDQNDLKDKLEYHYYFMEDFANHDGLLRFASDKLGKTILLDRYFFSNAAYLIHDFKKYCHNNGLGSTRISKYLKRLQENILYPFYKNLLQPDLIFYLTRYIDWEDYEQKDTRKLDNCYEVLFFDMAPNNLIYIKGLKSTTYDFIETQLDKRGYI